MRKYLIIFVIAISCSTADREKAFIEKHIDESFDEFVNILIELRSSNADNTSVYILTYLNTDCQREPSYFIRVSEKDVITIEERTTDNTCDHSYSRDSVQIRKVFDRFVRLGINSIFVDQDSDAYINLYGASKYSIVKFKDSYPEKFDNYERVIGNWYLKKK